MDRNSHRNLTADRHSLGQRSSTFSESSKTTTGDDPRLSRYSKYKSEKELYAEFEKSKSTGGTGGSSAPTANVSSVPTKVPAAIPPPPAPVMAIEVPPPATGNDKAAVFHSVMDLLARRCPSADVSLFKENCRKYGQDEMSLSVFFDYLRSLDSTTSTLKELIPQLVRLLPTAKKRQDVWNQYVNELA